MAEPCTALVTLERACASLSTCCDLSWVVQIEQKAKALEAVTRAMELGLEAQQRAGTIHLEATRRIGELTRELKNSGHLRSEKGRPKKNVLRNTFSEAAPASADDLGLNRDKIKRAASVASVPEEEFKAYLAEAATNGEEVTAAGLLKRHKPPKKKPKGGKVVFDYKKWELKVGDLFRLTDDHHKLYPDKVLHTACLESLNTYLADMKAWRKKKSA